jgi:AcrR family transcriptional regulator
MEMTKARLGRPPRVTTAQIAEAALAIGLERATVRNVAEHLEMSVPGLYHHVRTREDLLAIAAAHTLGALELPPDRGQEWNEWLLDYARFVYDALIAQPEVIGQILAGTVNTLRQAQHLERFFEVLGARGFSVAEAYETYLQLMGAVTGAATFSIGRTAASEAGHPQMVDVRRAAAALGIDAVPLVHELVGWRRAPDVDPFDTVHLVVAGMAGQRRDRAGRAPATARS